MIGYASRTRVVMAVFVVAAALRAAVGTAATPATLDEILAGWRQRREKYHTVTIEWTEKHTYFEGSKRGLDLRGAKPDGTLFPPKDTTVEQVSSLALDGRNFSHMREGPQWSELAENFEEVITAEVTNGTRNWHYYGSPAKEALVHPYGTTGPGADARTRMHMPLLKPVGFSFRPNDEEFDDSRVDSRWRVRGATETLRDRPCTVLEVVEPSGDTTCVIQLWIDAERDQSIVRYARAVYGNAVLQIDVNYRLDQEHGWLPNDWTVVLSASGESRVAESTVGTVTKCSVGDPIDPTEFTFEFPEGTLVTETIENSQSRQYISRGDGAKRLITSAERQRGARYPDLLGTDEGMALQPGPSGRPWLVWLSIAFAVASVVWYVCRRTGRG